ncbi:fungal-specific transcription factor domain-containing protein [Penicillium macrosclerotiorum]|uniref:fungal-specific transcription factor domain-containing protein n=1 Tax=Penicillium macrosclerotiorum TaxID=303699 RepID=UPI0025496014|nr:fungal-specific transcription factor domain-containing protein [Penicillium macrosclerotiorum]KAJ5698509.1 fungal-specific transcription factor domain-containing protein [Penicillium macrosclerotiorum]
MATRMTRAAPASTHRQRPGAACEECRRRKLRCDGQQPHCGVCQDAGIACEITKRSTRGPKKGHLKVLKNRIAYLESIVAGHNLNQEELQGDCRSTGEHTVLSSPVETTNISSLGAPVTSSPQNPRSHEFALPSKILQSELDQLYLDRVHQSMPILHQRRYLAWSKSSAKTDPQKCLQYAIWTLASLLSPQFYDMVEPLYQETKRLLESLSLGVNNNINASKELAQAWVLIVVFECMRTYHRQAWMSVGRAFRLVQAMRYHEIDSPLEKFESPSSYCIDHIELEERRRIFWSAYFLDHILSMRDDWPITLNEHVVR